MILVVGDYMLDEYLYGSIKRISPEAPVPVVSDCATDIRIGGAGNVSENIRTLGKESVLVGVVGEDREIPKDRETYLFIDKTRPTTVKTRVIAQGQQVVRIDRESTEWIKGETEASVIKFIDIAAPMADVIVLSDYCKGVVTENVINTCLHHKKPMLVDSKRENFSVFKDVMLVTPNREEYERVFVSAHAVATHVLVTLGADGMELHSGKQRKRIPASTQSVVDVTGAGDTVLAAMAVHIEEHGEDMIGAAKFATKCAAQVVQKQGTATVDRYEAMEML